MPLAERNLEAQDINGSSEPSPGGSTRSHSRTTILQRELAVGPNSWYEFDALGNTIIVQAPAPGVEEDYLEIKLGQLKNIPLATEQDGVAFISIYSGT